MHESPLVLTALHGTQRCMDSVVFTNSSAHAGQIRTCRPARELSPSHQICSTPTFARSRAYVQLEVGGGGLTITPIQLSNRQTSEVCSTRGIGKLTVPAKLMHFRGGFAKFVKTKAL